MGHKGYLISEHMIEDSPDMKGAQRDFAGESTSNKLFWAKSGLMAVAEEVGAGDKLANWWNPEELKSDEEKPKVAEGDKEEEASVLQLEYVKEQHVNHVLLLGFESSNDAEDEFNNDLAKELNIKQWGENKFLNNPVKASIIFHPPKKGADTEGASEATQLVKTIVDEGEAADEEMEAKNAEEKAAVQLKDAFTHAIVGNIIDEGDAAEAELNNPAPKIAQPKPVAVAEVKKEEETPLVYDDSDVQI